MRFYQVFIFLNLFSRQNLKIYLFIIIFIENESTKRMKTEFLVQMQKVLDSNDNILVIGGIFLFLFFIFIFIYFLYKYI